MNRARRARRLSVGLLVLVSWLLWLGGGITVGTLCGLDLARAVQLACASPVAAVLLGAALAPLFTR